MKNITILTDDDSFKEFFSYLNKSYKLNYIDSKNIDNSLEKKTDLLLADIEFGTHQIQEKIKETAKKSSKSIFINLWWDRSKIRVYHLDECLEFATAYYTFHRGHKENKKKFEEMKKFIKTVLVFDSVLKMKEKIDKYDFQDLYRFKT